MTLPWRGFSMTIQIKQKQTNKQTHILQACKKVYVHKYKKGKMLYHVIMVKNDISIYTEKSAMDRSCLKSQ